MYASYEGHAKVVKLLLEADADIQARNNVSGGTSYFHLAYLCFPPHFFISMRHNIKSFCSLKSPICLLLFLKVCLL